MRLFFACTHIMAAPKLTYQDVFGSSDSDDGARQREEDGDDEENEDEEDEDEEDEEEEDEEEEDEEEDEDVEEAEGGGRRLDSS